MKKVVKNKPRQINKIILFTNFTKSDEKLCLLTCGFFFSISILKSLIITKSVIF